MLVFFGVWGLDKKNKMILFPVILVVAAIGLFSAMSFNVDDLSNESQTPASVPSDILQANPNYAVQSEGEIDHIWATQDVKDVKDDVVYTILGTISSVGYDDEPIEWTYGNPDLPRKQILGFIPITISVDTIYKGNLVDDTFTFYLTLNKIDGTCPNCGEFNVIPDSKKYKIGEKFLFHFQHLDIGPFPDGVYIVTLGQYGKYHIVTVDGTRDFDITSISSDDLLAFNPHYPEGIPLDSISREALP